jgi:hypothetical protein
VAELRCEVRKANLVFIIIFFIDRQGVAQWISAPVLGAGGRGFDSHRPETYLNFR